MLQWTGGSRRKVNSSRKSTQKRQKQYFEQRRQQQHQQAPGLENHEDEVDVVTHNKEHRSLDILSLLNLSTAAQECRTSSQNERKTPDVDVSMANSHFTKCEPHIFTKSVWSADHVEFKEAGNSPDRHVDSVSPEKVSFIAMDDHANGSNVVGAKLSQWKSSDQQLSVFDLLGDDGLNGNPAVKPKNEDHVAFSVDGLGNVGTKTPVHSPRQSDRIHPYGCSSQLKAERGLPSSKNFSFKHDDLDFEMDTMMQDFNVPPCSISLGLPSYRRSMMNSFNNEDNCMQLDDHSKLWSSFDDRNIYDDIRDSKENIHNGRRSTRFSHPDDNFIDEKIYDTSWKNWSCQMDDDCVDILRFGSNTMSDFAFERPRSIQRKWDTQKATKIFSTLESVAPRYVHLDLEDSDHDDFGTSDLLRYSAARKNFNFGDVTNQHNRSYFATEDLMDNFSSISEESCCSSAVRGKVKISRSMEKHSSRRHNNNLSGSPSKASRHSNFTFENKAKSTNNWLFKEDSPLEDKKLGFGPFCQASETTFASPSCKFWTEDPFTVSKIEVNTKSLFQRSKHTDPTEYSYYGTGFFTEDLTDKKSFDSPAASNVAVGLNQPDLNLDSEKEPNTSDSYQVSGSDGDSMHPNFAVHEFVDEDLEKTPELQSSKEQRFQIVNNDLLSEIGNQTDSSDAKDYCSKSTEAENEKIERLKNSSENVEEISSRKEDKLGLFKVNNDLLSEIGNQTNSSDAKDYCSKSTEAENKKIERPKNSSENVEEISSRKEDKLGLFKVNNDLLSETGNQTNSSDAKDYCSKSTETENEKRERTTNSSENVEKISSRKEEKLSLVSAA